MHTLLRRSLVLGALSTLFTFGSASCQTTPPNGAGAGGSGNGSTSSSGGGGEAGTGGSAGMGTTSSSSSSGQGGTGGGGAGGTGGQGVGGGGTGGQGAGGAGGSGGCTSQQARCEYKTDTELDKQSYRQIAGYNCFKQGIGTEFVPLATCDYSETCELGNGLEASCVPCGPKGVRYTYREVDGVVKENCQGCKCSGGWAVYGCYAETATFGAPWADIVWQQGFEVIRFALLTTGEVKSLGAPNKQVTFQNLQINTMDIQLDGVVDFDVAATVLHTDNFQQQHVWNMQARVVGICK